MQQERAGKGALEGIRVVDLSNVVSGPLCTQILGDLGAEILKIESPVGDISRRLGPPFQDGLTPLYAQFNRNKRSLAVDLKAEAGVELVRRLATEADVFIENFRPGVETNMKTVQWPPPRHPDEHPPLATTIFIIFHHFHG